MLACNVISFPAARWWPPTTVDHKISQPTASYRLFLADSLVVSPFWKYHRQADRYQCHTAFMTNIVYTFTTFLSCSNYIVCVSFSAIWIEIKLRFYYWTKFIADCCPTDFFTDSAVHVKSRLQITITMLESKFKNFFFNAPGLQISKAIKCKRWH